MPKKRSSAKSAEREPAVASAIAAVVEPAPAQARELVAVSPDAWERSKAVAGFSTRDESILRELHLVARTYADEVMDELYARWLAVPEMRVFLSDDVTVERVKALQKAYFLRLTGGSYGAQYLADRLKIGHTHRRIGLSPRWYMAGYSIYLQLVLPRILAAFEYDRSKAKAAVCAVIKLVLLDQELALLAYGVGET